MAVDIEKKRRNKLKKVNVPELFCQVFLFPVAAGTSTIIDKLRNIQPTPRGQGFTRVIENISEEEWNDLYAYAAKARKAIQGADRETELKPAICGKALAFRMEELGVDNPVPWKPSKIYKKTVELSPEAEDTTDDVVDAASNPISIPTADDVEPVDDAERELLGAEIRQQQA